MFYALLIGTTGTLVGLCATSLTATFLGGWYVRKTSLRRLHSDAERQNRGEKQRAFTNVLTVIAAKLNSFKLFSKLVRTLRRTRLFPDALQDELETICKYYLNLSFFDTTLIGMAGLLSAATLVIVSGLVSLSLDLMLVGMLLFFIAACAIPRLLRRIVQRFRERIEFEMQELLTMLSLLTLAGTSFNRAIFEYLSSSESMLSQLIKPLWEQYQAGATTRAEALTHISCVAQVEILHKTCRSMEHSLELGSPLSVVLQAQLDDLKEMQKKHVEEEISKIPVKILIPLGLCILPAMLILLLGPILLEVLLGISS